MTIEFVDFRMPLTQKIALTVGAAVLVLGVSACSGSSEQTMSPVPAPTDSPTSTSTAVSLPSGWDAPEPVGAVLASATTHDGVLVATFRGSGDLTTAADSYAKQLGSSGWKADENNIVNKNSIWFKGDRRLQLAVEDVGSGKYDLVVLIEPKS